MMNLKLSAALFAAALAFTAVPAHAFENGAEEGLSSVEQMESPDSSFRPGRPGGPGRGPGYPGYPGRPGRPGPRPVECYARNARGITFRAQGWNPRQVQDRALQQCYRNSFNPRTCRPLGCR